MTDLLDIPTKLAWILYENAKQVPVSLLLLLVLTTVLSAFAFIYVALFAIAPIPRPPHPSEKTYVTTDPSGKQTSPTPLPCWYDTWRARRNKSHDTGDFTDNSIGDIEDAELFMSIVIPAYNEEERIEGMLEEAIVYLDATYGRPTGTNSGKENGHSTGTSTGESPSQQRGRKAAKGPSNPAGYEILVINDGSKDKTVDVCLRFSQKHQLHDVLRVVTLKENRGKGGAVTHGFRHVRGSYAIFVDADGASTFSDLGQLLESIQSSPETGVAVGSRAHLVGSEAVVKRSFLRNALMHSFHLLLRLLTPPATSRIRDTQCGFKLFSRASLPYIIPYMHAEGWIFDVEMLMLAESAPVKPDETKRPAGGPGIKVAEVQIGWHEIGGSKLNVMWDSIGMAWGLAVLRASWALGVYRRR